jgi:hypothetical protein
MTAVTLETFIERIREVGDYWNEDVFPDTFITRQVNTAIGEYSDLLDEAWEGYRDKTGTVVTVAATATVALPADHLKARAVAILVNGQYQPLDRYAIGQTYLYGAESGQPRGYMLVGANLELFPTPDAVYTLRLRYVPTSTVLAATQSIDVPNGWEDWIIYKALAVLDDREERDVAPRLAVCDRIEARIRSAAKQRDTAGPRYVPFPGEGGELLP